MSSAASNMQSRPEMEQALQAFTNLSENLLAGYDALRVRAEQMEAELVRTNAELASKVAELEAALGCSSEISDYLDDTLESCVEEVAAVADCFSANRSGCYCEEGDGRINCEGTFKENEGPVELGIPCASVMNASEACMPDEEE